MQHLQIFSWKVRKIFSPKNNLFLFLHWISDQMTGLHACIIIFQQVLQQIMLDNPCKTIMIYDKIFFLTPPSQTIKIPNKCLINCILTANSTHLSLVALEWWKKCQRTYNCLHASKNVWSQIWSCQNTCNPSRKHKTVNSVMMAAIFTD